MRGEMRAKLAADGITVAVQRTMNGSAVTFAGVGPEGVAGGPDGKLAAALTRALTHTVTVGYDMARTCDCGVPAYDCAFEWIVLHIE